jgi:hypothetical protein
MIYDLWMTNLSIKCVNFAANLRFMQIAHRKGNTFFVLYDETECKYKQGSYDT